MTIHKMKEYRIKKPFLINKDGSWNILCKTQSSHIIANWDWKNVTCKRCLKEYPHLTARIEIDIDCVNTSISFDEEAFLEQEIKKVIEARNMKVLRYSTL